MSTYAEYMARTGAKAKQSSTPRFDPAHPITGDLPIVVIDGAPVHLVDERIATTTIADAIARRTSKPLAVASINLDHVHHFGRSRRAARGLEPWTESGRVDWLDLVDGSPIAAQIERVTHHAYPKLSGSDLVGKVLDEAARHHQSVGVLGGAGQVTPALRDRFTSQWPTIRLAGHWTPERETLASAELSRALAAEIRAAGVDILIVCLGKPRQEEWIDEFGDQTGAAALLAFGAVVDFLAGRVSRAPHWVSDVGMEWAWRLMLEPRRLARRYLVQGPPAYAAVRRYCDG